MICITQEKKAIRPPLCTYLDIRNLQSYNDLNRISIVLSKGNSTSERYILF